MILGLFLPVAPRSPTNEQEMVMAYKIDECNGDQRQVKRCLTLLHAHHWNPEERATVYFDILNAFSKQVKEPIKHTPSKIVVYGLTVQDHNSYLYEMKLEYNCQYISRASQSFVYQKTYQTYALYLVLHPFF